MFAGTVLVSNFTKGWRDDKMPESLKIGLKSATLGALKF